MSEQYDKESSIAGNLTSNWVVWSCIIAGLRFVLATAFHGNHGYFRDELCYIVCSDHMVAGYVDQPPLSIALLWINIGGSPTPEANVADLMNVFSSVELVATTDSKYAMPFEVGRQIFICKGFRTTFQAI